MKIYSIYDPEFAAYGKIVDVPESVKNAIIKNLSEGTPLPEGVGYVAEEPCLQEIGEAVEYFNTLYDGSVVELGWCNGHNTKLNALEWHGEQEYNMGATDFVLLVAKDTDIIDGKLDSAKVMAFKAPAGVCVELPVSTLHYAPCQAAKDEGFKVLIVLAKGTNVGGPHLEGDPMLWANLKWLIVHPDSTEAGDGAYVGITGENVDIANLL